MLQLEYRLSHVGKISSSGTARILFTSLMLSLILNFNLMAQFTEVKSGVYEWDKLSVRKGEMREGRRLMEGSSPHFEYLEIHATTQQPGAKPAPPHTQEAIEEVLIVKEGKMKMTMDGESHILGPSSVILIPPLVEQSLENVGDTPLTYYVMMFRSKKPMDLERVEKAGGKRFINADDLISQKTAKGFRVNYLDGPTAMCENFEMHITQLDHKGPSHDPHKHADSEIMLILEGETELNLDGELIHAKAGDLYFIKSGQMHGISNVGDASAKYFAYRWR